MVRRMIKIEEQKCNGCGLCVNACHESAIVLQNGKAVLIRDDYCDGLGNCLPVCPTGAISFEEREAAAYDEEAVKRNQEEKTLACGCAGTHVQSIGRSQTQGVAQESSQTQGVAQESRLTQWPVQIKLVPVNAPYLQGASLLIAADCTAYAYGSFHEHFMKDRITMIGCPKLDEGDYTKKLTEILQSNEIKSISVARMEVPCCAGIERAVAMAVQACGKHLPVTYTMISVDGTIKTCTDNG